MKKHLNKFLQFIDELDNGFLEMGNKMSFQGFSLLFSEKRLQDFDVKIKSKKGLVGFPSSDFWRRISDGKLSCVRKFSKREKFALAGIPADAKFTSIKERKGESDIRRTGDV